jgi:DNA replication protein DnaC
MIENFKSHNNYSQTIPWLETKGKEMFGLNFKIYETDYSSIIKLIAYFMKDIKTCQEWNIDTNKGIILTGPIGCGKTSLMKLMGRLSTNNQKFVMKPCRDVSFEFIQDGYQIIHKYSNGKSFHPDPRTYCFDDLGTENNLKYFGNECNVMGEILLSRYDLFVSKKLKTHITTNLSASEIEMHYGNRVRSRLRELCNLVSFDSNTPDKRK